MAMLLGVLDGRFLRGKAELDLGTGVARARPAHEGFRFARCSRLKLYDPGMRLRTPRLHRRLCWLVDANPCHRN